MIFPPVPHAVADIDPRASIVSAHIELAQRSEMLSSNYLIDLHSCLRRLPAKDLISPVCLLIFKDSQKYHWIYIVNLYSALQ